MIAGLEQVGVAGHDITAERLGGLMTALAVLLEDPADFAVVADRTGRRLGGWFGGGRSAGQRQQQASEDHSRNRHGETLDRGISPMAIGPVGRSLKGRRARGRNFMLPE
jgi:hypothetical protein